MNNDCWTLVLDYAGENALNNVLQFACASKTFLSIVESLHLWTRIGRRLGLSPPKPKARKYKTWKSLVLKMRGKFCETCLKKATRALSIQIHTSAVGMKNHVCGPCAYQHRARELQQARVARDQRLGRLRNAFPSGFGDLSESGVFDCVSGYLNGDASYDHDKAVEKIQGFLSRRALISLQYPNISTEQKVQRWLLSGDGSIVDIAMFYHERTHRKAEREEELRQRLAMHGLKLREDSQLCEAYISDNEGSIDEIVDTMREMGWFFKCTAYDNLRHFEYDDDWGYRYRHSFHNDDWGDRNTYIDSERGKELALARWADDFVKLFGHVLTSPEDFTRHLADIPPPSLHSSIIDYIRKSLSNPENLLEAATNAASQAIDWSVKPDLPPVWRSVFSEDAWEKGKLMALKKYEWCILHL